MNQLPAKDFVLKFFNEENTDFLPLIGWDDWMRCMETYKNVALSALSTDQFKGVWTGMTDIKGVKIYEGDKIETSRGDWGIVVWKAPYFEITISETQSSNYSREWWETIKVIESNNRPPIPSLSLLVEEADNPDEIILWKDLFEEIQRWYGDIKKQETTHDFEQRMAATFKISLRNNDYQPYRFWDSQQQTLRTVSHELLPVEGRMLFEAIPVTVELAPIEGFYDVVLAERRLLDQQYWTGNFWTDTEYREERSEFQPTHWIRPVSPARVEQKEEKSDAIDFAEWIDKNVCAEHGDEDGECWWYISGKCYTTAELYQLFKTQSA